MCNCASFPCTCTPSHAPPKGLRSSDRRQHRRACIPGECKPCDECNCTSQCPDLHCSFKQFWSGTYACLQWLRSLHVTHVDRYIPSALLLYNYVRMCLCQVCGSRPVQTCAYRPRPHCVALTKHCVPRHASLLWQKACQGIPGTYHYGLGLGTKWQHACMACPNYILTMTGKH